ncbi:TetR/AcrR family transcriptional regulator [Pseudomaricurvus alkylphenolicus]|uniref:TetR/AcrR family transcriptional regulator n=1 Tax=Pseudomaricurvus alkylphenolicus TaxID=1306991 RepID=UPI001420717E|nr:TetR/AcrR family transcriptional regulator [Pseudomaricurvus alkylphenolicus]NIB43564.1 TetR/AcrR family transcriptional regulator [Pseudomaricurvus alkylphenolicus]
MCPAPKCCPVEQEQKILQAAAECVEQTSLLDFTMSAIAKKAGVSMGSIYKHVHTKEDVLIALGMHTFENLQSVFRRILALDDLTPAQRLLAISLFDYNKVDPYPFSRHLEMLISSDAVQRRGSAHWLEKLTQSNAGCMQIFREFLEKTVEQDNLGTEGEPLEYLERLNLAIWTMGVGHIQVVLQQYSLKSRLAENAADHGLPFPLPVNDPHVVNMQQLINSFLWREPLQPEHILQVAERLEELGLR